LRGKSSSRTSGPTSRAKLWAGALSTSPCCVLSLLVRVSACVPPQRSCRREHWCLACDWSAECSNGNAAHRCPVLMLSSNVACLAHTHLCRCMRALVMTVTDEQDGQRDQEQVEQHPEATAQPMPRPHPEDPGGGWRACRACHAAGCKCSCGGRSWSRPSSRLGAADTPHRGLPVSQRRCRWWYDPSPSSPQCAFKTLESHPVACHLLRVQRTNGPCLTALSFRPRPRYVAQAACPLKCRFSAVLS
jgi:hypothetical protein